MAETSLPAHKMKRYPDGIISKWSERHRRMMWGFDVRIGSSRRRVCKYDSREHAETELKILKAKDDCERHGLVFDDSETDIPNAIWTKFEILLECKIGAVGATAELLIAADLLRRGYDVYRSVASNADCDLIAGRFNKLCRIEVKSAVIRNGVTRFKRHRLNPLAHDVLALCFLRDLKIEYRPSVEEWFNQRVEGLPYSGSIGTPAASVDSRRGR